MTKHFYPRDASKASKGQRQARIHTGFHRFTEMGQIFYSKYIFDNKKTISKLKSGQYPVWMTRKPRQGEISWGNLPPDPPGNLRLRRSFLEIGQYILSYIRAWKNLTYNPCSKT